MRSLNYWTCQITDLISALLGYYAASSGSSVSTFRDNLSVPSSRVKKSSLYRTTAQRCVISQKSTDLIYIAAEAWNHECVKQQLRLEVVQEEETASIMRHVRNNLSPLCKRDNSALLSSASSGVTASGSAIDPPCCAIKKQGTAAHCSADGALLQKWNN